MNSTPGPVSITSPVISWPRIRPSGAVVRPRTMCWSEPQMFVATHLRIAPCGQLAADVGRVDARAVLELEGGEVDVLDLDLAGAHVGNAAVVCHFSLLSFEVQYRWAYPLRRRLAHRSPRQAKGCAGSAYSSCSASCALRSRQRVWRASVRARVSLVDGMIAAAVAAAAHRKRVLPARHMRLELGGRLLELCAKPLWQIRRHSGAKLNQVVEKARWRSDHRYVTSASMLTYDH